MMRRANLTTIVLFLTLCATQSALTVCAGEFEDQYAVAAGHYAQQRWEEAFQAFEQLPESDLALAQTTPFFQAEALHQLRRFDEAVQHYRKYLGQTVHVGYRDLASFRIAECLVLNGQHRRALAALAAFAASHPEDPRRGHVQLYKGQCHLELREPQEAQAAYLKALEFLMQQDDYPELTAKCRFGMGKALQELGERKQANRFFRFLTTSDSEMADDALCQIILNQWAEGIESETEIHDVQSDIDQFREAFPTSVLREDVELVAARLLRKRGEHRRAAEMLVDVVDETTLPAVGGDMLFEAGRAFHATGDVDGSRRCFQRLVRRWPEHGAADDAAYCLVLLAEQRQVASRCERFLQTYPASEYWPEVTELMAETLIHQQQFDAAANCLDEWDARVESVPPRVHYLKMLACLGAKRYQSGVEAAERLQTDALAPALRTGMLLTYGALLAKTKQLAQADRVLSECLRLCANTARASVGEPRESHRTVNSDTLAQCAAQRAVVLAEQHQIEEAMEMALLSLQANGEQHSSLTPNQAETLRYIAAKAREVKAPTEASLMLELLDERGAATERDQQMLVVALWSSNRRVQARRRLEALQERRATAPGVHRATLRAGRILEREGDWQAALQQYRWLSGRAGGAGRAGSFHAGRLLEQRGKDREAIDYLQPVMAELAASAKAKVDGATEKKVELDAPRDAVLYHLGWALKDSDQSTEAREVFDELARSGSDRSLKLDAVFRAAKLDAAAGRLAAAEARLNEALVPENVAGEAPDLESRAIVWQLRMLRGHVAASQGKWADVVRQVSHLAESQEPPPSVREDAAFLVAEAYYRQRQLDRAEQWLQRSAKLAAAAADSPAWRVLAQLRQAQIQASKRQWRAAAAASQRLLDEHPNFARRSEAAYLLGRAHAARARFADAREAYKRVLAFPEAKGTVTAAKAQWMIGESFYHQRRMQEAIDAYHRVELLHGHSQWQALALLQVAKCHRDLGNEARAESMLRSLLRRFPESRASQEARQELTAAVTQAAPRR